MKLTFGFEIDNILKNDINEEKAQIFVNFDQASLSKNLSYSYSNTTYKSWRKDDCYHCTIIDFANKGFEIRNKIRAKNGY